MPRWWTWAGAAGVLVALATARGEVELVAPTAVATAGENHAAVIVDTGQTVKKVCVTFSEEAISGAEALRRANVDAVFTSYGDKGQGVCAICGVGCPAGDCFCDRSRFWAYHRAAPGGAYAFSRAGASSTTVRDGDVEGWRWGTGGAPPYASVGEVCGVAEPAPGLQPPEPTTTEAPAPGGPPTASTAAEQAPPAGEPPRPSTSTRPLATGAPGPPPPAAPGPVSSAPGAPQVPPEVEDPAVDEAPETAGEAPAGQQAAPPTRPAADRRAAQAPTPASLAAFLLVLGGLVGWRWRLRRSAQVRRRSGVG